MNPNAPYSGGFAPRAQLFAVDGDFTQCDPAGPPEISFPFTGDSILSTRDIFYVDAGGAPPIQYSYLFFPLGEFPNIQPWSANQVAMVLEQEFIVAQSSYQPMRLNTQYNSKAWSLGWVGTFPDGQPIPTLGTLILVKEGDLQDIGGGLCKLRRVWASLPPTRNELEQYSYQFPGYETGRDAVTLNVMSRVQYDYYIFDDWGVLTDAYNPFPDGPILNSLTGTSPAGLVLVPFFVWTDQDGVPNNQFSTPPVLTGDGTSADNTVPGLTPYQGAVTGATTSNGLPAEIVVEASTMTRWRGNIFEKRTRFVVAQ